MTLSSDDDQTTALLEAIRARHASVDAFISNVAFALVVDGLEGYSKRALFKGIEYSAWPLVEYPRRIKAVFGRYPRYIVGLSSSGPDVYCHNYDFVAAGKALAEGVGGKTLACAYSARASAFAGVSTPLMWSEVDDQIEPRDFTIKTVEARLQKVGDLWEALRTTRPADLSAALEKLAR